MKFTEFVTEDKAKSMSRAAKGHEKYGKEGMQALAKAGREGASEKTLDTIRDKHNKYDESVEETAAWRRKEGKSKTGGLNKKGVASYRRENPGSKLQTAVTTKPSKLKKGSKAAKRRKSFCARMGGVKGPMKKPNGKPTRKALALRKWNCESVEQLENMLMIAESWAKEKGIV